MPDRPHPLTQQLVASLRDLAALKRAEAEQCERTAAMLERELHDGSALGSTLGSALDGLRADATASDGRRRRGAGREAGSGAAGSSRQPTARQAAIVELLESDPTRVWSPREIAAATGLNASSVRTFLQMLSAQGAIARSGVGRYQARSGASRGRSRRGGAGRGATAGSGATGGTDANSTNGAGPRRRRSRAASSAG